MMKKHKSLLFTGLLFFLPVSLAVAEEARSIWNKRVETPQQWVKSDNPWNIQIPSKDGFIIEYAAPKLSPLVVHIQDAHANPPAQIHISAILRELVGKHHLKLVCVEGADGGFDDSLFNIDKVSLKEKVVRSFLNDARLTGAEYEWILHSQPGASYPLPFTLWGIERQEVYQEHWNVWEKTRKTQKETVELAEQVLKKVHSNYGKHASEGLLRYEQTAEAFRQGVSGLKEYLQELGKILEKNPTDMSRYPETVKLLNILKGEQTGSLMIGLTSTGELDRLEQEIRLTLTQSPSEKEYVQWSRLAGLFVRFVKLEMTPAEWKEYQPQTTVWESFVTEKLQMTLPELVSFRQFYELAQKRDQILFENAFSKMKEIEQNRLALVAGGFHSYGITDHLRENGIPYLVIAPRVDAPTDPAVYTQAMYGQPLTEKEIQETMAKVQ